MIIKVTIDRFEGDKAVLITEKSDTIIWPKKDLPPDAKEGEGLIIAITGDIEKDKDSRQLAKDILNEIINPEKND